MTASPMVTWPSAAMTTLLPRRTQMTVVERMRGAREACCGVWKEEPPPEAAEEENLRFDMLLPVYRPNGADFASLRRIWESGKTALFPE